MLLESDLGPAAVLRRVFEHLEPTEDWSFGSATRQETSYLTHGYFRYPAKFIPHLPRRMIQDYYRAPGLVVDPFMGSGTTLVESVVAGIDSYGSDVNIAAFLASRAKTRALDPTELESICEGLFSAWQTDMPGFDPIVSEPTTRLARAEDDEQRLSYWFPDEQLARLDQIFTAIEDQVEEVRDFLRCGFAHILKNCSRWLMSSVKPTVDRSKKIPDPLPVLRRHLRKMMGRNRSFHDMDQRGEARVELGDCRQLGLEDNEAALIVTSSPYITSYEYSDLHQLVSIWFRARSDLKWDQREFIGTSRVRHRQPGVLRGQVAGEIVDAATKVSPRFRDEVATYFADMESAFAEFSRILRPDGFACFVIGDTTIRDVEMANGLAFADSCRHYGLALHDVIERIIPRGGKILPSTRDPSTGRFTSSKQEDLVEAYASEYIVVVRRE